MLTRRDLARRAMPAAVLWITVAGFALLWLGIPWLGQAMCGPWGQCPGLG